MTALWWVPAGHRPTVSEAEERLLHLRAHGPTPYAFTLRTSFPPGATAQVAGSITKWTRGEQVLREGLTGLLTRSLIREVNRR